MAHLLLWPVCGHHFLIVTSLHTVINENKEREREREIFINNKLLAIPQVQQLKWSKWHLKLKSYESKLKVWKNRQRNEIFVTGFISLTSLFTFIEKIRILSSPRVLWGSGCKRYHNMTVYLNPVNPSLS